MKVLDPQAALLTNAEVLQALSRDRLYRVRKPTALDAYQPVNLKGYDRVKSDIASYVKATIPFTETYPPPDTWMEPLVAQLSKFGLTKTEALTIINLGIGLRKPSSEGSAEAEDDGDADGQTSEEAAAESQEQDYTQILTLVVDEFEDRFPGDEGEAMVQQIVAVMKAEIGRAQAAVASENGTQAHD